jgi:hypothetical protein
VNNGTFLCTASTATTLTLTNAAAVVETHAGTAQALVGAAQYFSYGDPANKAEHPSSLVQARATSRVTIRTSLR